MLSLVAEFIERCRRFIDLFADADIADRRFSGARTAAVVPGALILEADLEAEDIDPALVLFVFRFSVDAVELEKHVNSHFTSLRLSTNTNPIRRHALPDRAS